MTARITHLIDGVEDTIKGHAIRRGIPPKTVYSCVNIHGMTLEEALRAGPGKVNRRGLRARTNTESQTQSEAAISRLRWINEWPCKPWRKAA